MALIFRSVIIIREREDNTWISFVEIGLTIGAVLVIEISVLPGQRRA
jgi:hypothetical protein